MTSSRFCHHSADHTLSNDILCTTPFKARLGRSESRAARVLFCPNCRPKMRPQLKKLNAIDTNTGRLLDIFPVLLLSTYVKSLFVDSRRRLQLYRLCTSYFFANFAMKLGHTPSVKINKKYLRMYLAKKAVIKFPQWSEMTEEVGVFHR